MSKNAYSLQNEQEVFFRKKENWGRAEFRWHFSSLPTNHICLGMLYVYRNHDIGQYQTITRRIDRFDFSQFALS
jgi:hypothetical protein